MAFSKPTPSQGEGAGGRRGDREALNPFQGGGGHSPPARHFTFLALVTSVALEGLVAPSKRCHLTPAASPNPMTPHPRPPARLEDPNLHLRATAT